MKQIDFDEMRRLESVGNRAINVVIEFANKDDYDDLKRLSFLLAELRHFAGQGKDLSAVERLISLFK